MLTVEENRKYWIMCSDYSDEYEDIPIPRKVWKPPGECMNTDKEENRKMREKIISTQEEYETCVRCGKETKYKKSDHIDHRYGYIEGAGQLCFMCSQTRKMHKQGAYE